MLSQRRSSGRAGVIEGGEVGLGDHGLWITSAIDRRQLRGIEGGMDAIVDHLLLQPHPAARPDAIAGVTCGVSWGGAGEWVFDFIVSEPPEALRLPAVVPAARADDLWRTTCFELFLRRPGEDAYMEFNFSPSGEWSAWAFDGYRDGRRNLEIASPIITTADPARFAMAVMDRMLALGLDAESARRLADVSGPTPEPAGPFALSVAFQDPAFATRGPWVAGLSAVIEERHGPKSYWALAHASDKPDFHHPDSFVLELP